MPELSRKKMYLNIRNTGMWLNLDLICIRIICIYLLFLFVIFSANYFKKKLMKNVIYRTFLSNTVLNTTFPNLMWFQCNHSLCILFTCNFLLLYTCYSLFPNIKCFFTMDIMVHFVYAIYSKEKPVCI